MKRLKRLRMTGVGVTLVTLVLVTSGLAAAPGYHLIKTYKLGGDGGWDYLTSTTPQIGCIFRDPPTSS